MIESSKNKAIDPAQNVTVTAKSQIVNDYHFAGAPDYEALSVTANTIEDATALWEKKRVPVKRGDIKTEAKPEEKKPDEKVEQAKTDDQS
jgi:hypothetical protein